MHLLSNVSINNKIIQVSKRYADGEGPELFYTDSCCKERRFLSNVFPSLSDGVQDESGGNHQTVLLDAFHFMDRIKVSKHHSMYRPFMARLRDAIFVPSKDDINHNNQIATNRNGTPISISHQFNRIRRCIPEPAVLRANITHLTDTFKKAAPEFITPAVETSITNCLKHVDCGCLSDHPNVSLYYQIKEGSDDTYQQLRTSRGTSQLECFHRYIYSIFTGKKLSVRLFDAILMEAVFRWNSDRSVSNKLDKDWNTYSIDLVERIHNLYISNQQYFSSNPVPDFRPCVYDESAIERFGCSRVVKTEDELNEYGFA